MSAEIDWTAISAVVTAIAAGVAAWYTIITDRLRKASEAQVKLLERQVAIAESEAAQSRAAYEKEQDLMDKAAMPIFRWGGGNAGPGMVQYKLSNQGGRAHKITFDGNGCEVSPKTVTLFDAKESVTVTLVRPNQTVARHGVDMTFTTDRGKTHRFFFIVDWLNGTTTEPEAR